VIKIDEENIQSGLYKKTSLGIKKSKRKKGCIDEILLQVEAKKRKEELMSKAEENKADVNSNNAEKDLSKTRTSTNRNPLSVTKTLTEFQKDEAYILQTKNKLLHINSQEKVIPHTAITRNHRNDIEYRLQPRIKLSAFDETSKNDTMTDKRTHPTFYPLATSEQNLEPNKNEMKNENLPRKKKRLTANERYSNLTSSQLQRRLVANARERSRVHALSNAFDTLRSAIPSYSPEQKISKLTILRVAINYINALQEILSTDSMNIYENRAFVSHVNECSCVLQTEYGRSKMKLAID